MLLLAQSSAKPDVENPPVLIFLIGFAGELVFMVLSCFVHLFLGGIGFLQRLTATKCRDFENENSLHETFQGTGSALKPLSTPTVPSARDLSTRWSRTGSNGRYGL